MSAQRLSLDQLREIARGTRPLAVPEYEAAVRATFEHTRIAMVLVGYAVRLRGIVGEGGGTPSVTRLVEDTVTTARSPQAWRSTISKYVSTWRMVVEAGLAERLTPEDVEQAIRAYDSTAEGRQVLRLGVEMLSGLDDKEERYRRFLQTCTAAQYTKVVASKRRAFALAGEEDISTWEIRLGRLAAQAAEAAPALGSEGRALAAALARQIDAEVSGTATLHDRSESEPIDVDPESYSALLARAVIESSTFQRQHQNAGRRAVTTDVAERLIASTLGSGGRATSRRLASTVSLDRRSFVPLLAALRRLMNIEGYEVIRLDGDGETVVIDEQLLCEQFLEASRA